MNGAGRADLAGAESLPRALPGGKRSTVVMELVCSAVSLLACISGTYWATVPLLLALWLAGFDWRLTSSHSAHGWTPEGMEHVLSLFRSASQQNPSIVGKLRFHLSGLSPIISSASPSTGVQIACTPEVLQLEDEEISSLMQILLEGHFSRAGTYGMHQSSEPTSILMRPYPAVRLAQAIVLVGWLVYFVYDVFSIMTAMAFSTFLGHVEQAFLSIPFLFTATVLLAALGNLYVGKSYLRLNLRTQGAHITEAERKAAALECGMQKSLFPGLLHSAYALRMQTQWKMSVAMQE